MSPNRMIFAVVLSSFLALATVSCDRDKPADTTGEKKVEQTTPPPSTTPQPGVTPGPTTGEKPAEPGDTAPKTQ